MTAPLMEFHPSMSLEHHAAPTSIIKQPSPAISSGAPDRPSAPDPDRVWHDVNDTLHSLAALDAPLAADDSAAIEKLQQLKKLHSICHSRETHVQTIKLGLMAERNAYVAKLVALQAHARTLAADSVVRTTLLQSLAKLKTSIHHPPSNNSTSGSAHHHHHHSSSTGKK
ncbi:hypothetical protein SDRG_03013 [Saprolegnia diclina VS20]|uniref:Uncharacterized protein n=1 Tax=Saprolegnia diclina (strain VS20) TaxID=1156394 RepID=T0QNC5_SAPDV|nr:hypothetical protein SDRG_03013 [Saprolegnia diclina VS20]EQC39579.1 hypothetical protein SDRG_03013 [Saprolegnia diclina VS20]|eukprot:XP_008606851.1 hypothetical protein SDRG_03013 [Saprolegnia diclina VS20]